MSFNNSNLESKTGFVGLFQWQRTIIKTPLKPVVVVWIHLVVGEIGSWENL